MAIVVPLTIGLRASIQRRSVLSIWISPASDRCRTQGHRKAAGQPDSESLRADAGKTPR
jgi:hypothetical protein